MEGRPKAPIDPTRGGEEPRPEASAGLLRDVLLPALLAAAIMLAVWWYWRVSVVDVGERAARESPAGRSR